MKHKIQIIYDDTDLQGVSEEELIERVKNLNEYDLDFIFYSLVKLNFL